MYHTLKLVGVPYTLPAGTPKDRVHLLRSSFLGTLKDHEYIAEASKTSLTIGPVTGEEI